MYKTIRLHIKENNSSISIQVPENISLQDLTEILAENGFNLPEGLETVFVAENSAITDYETLPDWLRTWTANEASQHVHENVLNGLDSLGVDAYVDGLPNTVAGMKTGLKQIGGALVAIRDILEIIAKLLMYIRDLVIRFRSS